MRFRNIAFVFVVALAGCSTSSIVEPIPGSITYHGQPRSKLQKAPVGSTFSHTFYDERGRKAIETYRIGPDRSLQLLDRRFVPALQILGDD